MTLGVVGSTVMTVIAYLFIASMVAYWFRRLILRRQPWKPSPGARHRRRGVRLSVAVDDPGRCDGAAVHAGRVVAPMRTIGQLVAVLLLVGFVGAYFWWIIAVLAVVALAWMAQRAFREIEAEEAADARRAQAEARRRAAMAARADQQHAWVMARDDRGVYGLYPPAAI
jgi:hypothetical protein